MKKLCVNPFLKCFIGDLHYMIISPRFLGACLAFTGISLASVLDELKMFPGASVFYLYTVYNYYPFWLLFLLFAVVPGATGFCVDFENRYYRYRILRFGKKNYAVSKAISCAASASLLVFLSQWLFIAILSLRGSVFMNGDGSTKQGSIYAPFMNENEIWIYFLIRILILSASAGFFSVFALWISTKIVNIFVVLASPLILYYLIENLSIAFNLPVYFSFPKIIRGTIELKSGPGATLLYAVGIFAGMTVVFIIAFYFSCRKRCENA